MKIVWISHGSRLSGAELCLLEAVEGLARQRVDVHVIVPSDGPLIERLEALGISVSIIPANWWMSFKGLRSPLRRAWRLARNIIACKSATRLLKEVRPDVVVTNTLTVPYGAVAARFVGTSHVWYVHEFGEEDHGLLFDLGEHLTLALVNRLSEKIIVNSTATLNKFRRYFSPDKLSLVYYGVPVPVQGNNENQPGSPLELILIGYISPAKGQDEAVRALASLREKQLSLRLTLIGAEWEDYGSYLRALASELQVSDSIRFVPFTTDRLRFMQEADLALICSRAEAFGRVTIEAMKLGKPVVGANTGATLELIKDGWNGLLYRHGDPKDLAKKIEYLYDNRSLVAEMGRNAQSWATQEFSSERYTAGLLDVLTDAATQHGKTVARTTC